MLHKIKTDDKEGDVERRYLLLPGTIDDLQQKVSGITSLEALLIENRPRQHTTEKNPSKTVLESTLEEGIDKNDLFKTLKELEDFHAKKQTISNEKTSYTLVTLFIKSDALKSKKTTIVSTDIERHSLRPYTHTRSVSDTSDYSTQNQSDIIAPLSRSQTSLMSSRQKRPNANLLTDQKNVKNTTPRKK